MNAAHRSSDLKNSELEPQVLFQMLHRIPYDDELSAFIEDWDLVMKHLDLKKALHEGRQRRYNKRIVEAQIGMLPGIAKRNVDFHLFPTTVDHWKLNRPLFALFSTPATPFDSLTYNEDARLYPGTGYDAFAPDDCV